MTKEQLAKLGIVVENDLTDDEANELILKKLAEKDGEIKNQKDMISKRNSEINALKDKEKERMTDEEKKAQAQQELEKELASLRRENALNKKVSEYLEIGYDKELATKVANAELDGKSTAQFHKQFIETQRESLKAELLAKTPTPSGNNDNNPTQFTKENFKKGLISMEDMNKLQAENPTLYKEIIS